MTSSLPRLKIAPVTLWGIWLLGKVYIMSNLYWHIEGYDSLDKIYDRKVKVGYFSQNQIQALLKALAAKAYLNFNEIVGAYAKKGTKIANDLLYIHKDGPHPTYFCGTNPCFIARVIREDA
jgi:hypothetical protein